MFGENGRIGVVIPANNSTLEPEIWPLLPPGVALYGTRILARGDLTPVAVIAMERHFDRAVDELVATGVDVIVYADMVTTLIMEPGWNRERTAAVSARIGLPCISAWTALETALAAMGIRRIALGTPYPSAIHALAKPFLKTAGYDVVADATLDIVAMTDVPRIAADRLRRFVATIDVDGADALVLLATDLPSLALIGELEATVGRPVISSNSAILWAALRACGNPTRAPALGELGGLSGRATPDT